MANRELTPKELFERLVVTETKLTALNNENRKTRRLFHLLFHLYVLIMIILFITNIFIHVFALIG